MVKVSFIIPLYNAAKYIEQCVESITNQYLNDYEIIIINDGSTDNSLNIANEIASRNNNIKVYNQKNKGAAAARNIGLKYADGNYILFVDADDYLENNTLRPLINIVNAEQLDVLEFRAKIYNSKGYCHIGFVQPKSIKLNHIYSGEESLKKRVVVNSVCNKIYSRDFIKRTKVQFLEGITREDVIFNMMLYPFIKRIEFHDIPIYNYRWNENSVDRSKDIDKIVKNFSNDLKVAYYTKILSSQNSYSKNIQTIYRKRSNSIIFSIFSSIIRRKDITYKYVNKLIIEAKQLNLFPIYGSTYSWKTTLLVPFINTLISIISLKNKVMCTQH